MKKVSIKSNAYNEYVAFIGTGRETTFATEWEATEWLAVKVIEGYTVSVHSVVPKYEVEHHIRMYKSKP